MRLHETPIVVFEEFLSASELESLHNFVARHHLDFVVSTVLGKDGKVVDETSRRSRVLYHVGEYDSLFRRRIRHFLPLILHRLRLSMSSIAAFEVQLTATNDGEFFGAHTDSDDGILSTRTVTFVYYCHLEPRRFRGGELQIYGRDPVSGRDVTNARHIIKPTQNSIVFFPSDRLHEITPVICPSKAFLDSRFTVNGWLRR